MESPNWGMETSLGEIGVDPSCLCLDDFTTTMQVMNIPGPNSTESTTNRPILPKGQVHRHVRDSASSGSSPPEPLIRKGHTKSRRGCLNCKRRRIKCPENHPTCTLCMRRGLMCEWPEVQFHQSMPIARRASPLLPPLKTPESKFTAQDFRFFYHFMKCYPHQPLGNDSIWTHEVPSIAHNHDFLLHAMLGLSASDIAKDIADSSALDLSATALYHRHRAIQSLNRALSTPNLSSESGNAMLATCYALIFQSVLLADGLPDYMTFIRGCVLVMQQMAKNRLHMLFQNITGGVETRLEKLEQSMETGARIMEDRLLEAKTSLEAMKDIVGHEGWQFNMWRALIGVVDSLQISGRDAYIAISVVYGLFSYYMSHAEFQAFIDPSNTVSQILQSHLVTVSTLLGPVSAAEKAGRPKEAHLTVQWLGPIHANIKGEMRRYIEWPIKRGQCILEDQARGKDRLGYNLDVRRESETVQ